MKNVIFLILKNTKQNLKNSSVMYVKVYILTQTSYRWYILFHCSCSYLFCGGDAVNVVEEVYRWIKLLSDNFYELCYYFVLPVASNLKKLVNSGEISE